MVRIVVRRLAHTFEEAEAMSRFEAATSRLAADEEVSAEAVGRCRVQYFAGGKKSKRRGIIPGRLYVVCPEALETRLVASLRASFGVVDDADPWNPSVERAAFDKVFREPSRRDKRSGTWLKSAEFAAFEQYEANLATGAKEVEASAPKKTSALVEFVNTKGSLFSKRGGGGGKGEANKETVDDDKKRAKRIREKRRKKVDDAQAKQPQKKPASDANAADAPAKGATKHLKPSKGRKPPKADTATSS